MVALCYAVSVQATASQPVSEGVQPELVLPPAAQQAQQEAQHGALQAQQEALPPAQAGHQEVQGGWQAGAAGVGRGSLPQQAQHGAQQVQHAAGVRWWLLAAMW